MKQIKWIMLLLAALLLAGVISHALAKSGQCDECGEKTEWILRNVSDTYTGEYYCSVCGAKMTDGTVIDLHQESQPEDPPVSGGQQPELPPTAQKPSEETEPPALPPQTVSETLPPKPATTAAPQQQPAQQKASPADQNKKQTTKSESTVLQVLIPETRDLQHYPIFDERFPTRRLNIPADPDAWAEMAGEPVI